MGGWFGTHRCLSCQDSRLGSPSSMKSGEGAETSVCRTRFTSFYMSWADFPPRNSPTRTRVPRALLFKVAKLLKWPAHLPTVCWARQLCGHTDSPEKNLRGGKSPQACLLFKSSCLRGQARWDCSMAGLHVGEVQKCSVKAPFCLMRDSLVGTCIQESKGVAVIRVWAL